VTAATFTATAWSQLSASITRWTGFHPDAIWARAVHAIVEPLLAQGLPAEEVISRAQRDDPVLRRGLTQAVPVGETYFFRQPQHFAFVREALAPRWAADPERPRHIWSAGCAAGEEAYSLAAVLRCGGVRSFDVVGTDLVEANVAAARAGRYGPWSLRGDGRGCEDPFLGKGTRDGWCEVHPDLRARTRFEARNLLDGPPAPGRFDLVFCRNVLIYFTREAAARAVEALASALAPGGVVAFATMDLDAAPEGLVRIGAPELQLFERPESGAVPAASRARAAGARLAPVREPPAAPAAAHPRAAVSATAPATSASSAPPEPVRIHLQALAHIEGGEHALARALLEDLHRVAPEYLPGLLEVALLHAREGRRARAAGVMRAVLERAAALPADAPIAGPEALPASFYVATARTFLGAEVRR
jgi:chemotaxis protein methyltransferase CheR